MSAIYEKLMKVQQEVRATKDAYNSFGKYSYRSCESILEAVKPILASNKALILLSDNIEVKESRTYVTATAALIDIETGDKVEVTASAREADAKKGMDEAQITGAASSYARKYALAGLLLLDDNKDPDATNKHGKDSDYDTNKRISDSQAQVIDLFLDQMDKKQPGMKAKILKGYKVSETDELTIAQYVDICKRGNIDAHAEITK